MPSIHRSILAALAAIALAGTATAQSWPSKPIRMINPLGTGGTAEVLARTIARQLSEQLGQPIILETKTGAAGTIGADYVAKSTPDGYTLLYGVTGMISIAPSLYRKLPYDPEKDLAPISNAVIGPNVLIVSTSLAVNTLQELIALAKSRPGALTFASAGSGSMSHLNGELFKAQAGIDLLHVPYKGGGAAVPDLMSGQVNMMIETSAGVPQLIRSGKLKPLAVTTRGRFSQLPEVPSFTELGFPEIVSSVWGGVFAPGGTPRAILDRVSEELARAARTPAYREFLASINNEPISSTPEEFRAFLREEKAKYADVIRRTGTRIE